MNQSLSNGFHLFYEYPTYRNLQGCLAVLHLLLSFLKNAMTKDTAKEKKKNQNKVSHFGSHEKVILSANTVLHMVQQKAFASSQLMLREM